MRTTSLRAEAAALRVLAERPIKEIDPAREIHRSRRPGEENPPEQLIRNAVRIACEHLMLPPVPYRHLVLAIPKILRRLFLRDRRLLADLSRCGWQALKTVIRAAVPEADPQPGAIAATQSFGEFAERFHPHLHILATDGAFYLSACGHAQAGGKRLFRVASRFPMKALERLFRHNQKSYDALEWLAAMGTHVPGRGQQSIRYYGFLSNASRGKRRKEEHEGAEPLPTVLEPQAPTEGFGKNSAWARSIQKVYEVDPLECPKCGADMRVIAFITDPAVVRKILEHLGLWLANARPVPRAQSPPPGPEGRPDPSFSQLPPSYENELSQRPPAEWDF